MNEKTIIENNPQPLNPEKEGKQPEDKKKSKKVLYFGTGGFLILLVVLISVFMTIHLMKNDSNEEGGAYTSTEASNTELKSGSVTTTIDGKTVTYNAAYVVDGIDATITSGTYESTTDDEVVFLVINGGTLKIDDEVVVNKSGSEDFAGRGDNYSFYGTNSAIVVVGEGSSASIDGATINTNVSGANAVVATNGAEVLIEDSTIATMKDNSRGLHATYKGTINADDVTIDTKGGSCASLATDRGEGTVVANDMKLSTAGAGSPLIYSTGSITVTDSTGTATGAQIAVVEGKNSINLNGCEFSANGNGNRGSVDNAGVMIYQSMSGDANVGNGSFAATDCTLTLLDSSSVYADAPFFLITNTKATIDLSGSTINFNPNTYFISAVGTNEWGKFGQNGGQVKVTLGNTTATNTKTEVDAISSVEGI